MVLQTVRSLLFYAAYLGQTIVIAIVLGTVTLFKPGWNRFSWGIANYWGKSNLFLLRALVGIRTRVEGVENIPPGGCILAAKHQSDWDIFAVLPYTGRPAYIVKRELMRIPFFGWAARALDCISVDRSKGAEAIPDLLRQAQAAADRGCRIIIFPEGTRGLPLTNTTYRIGVARMYAALNVPVVPVALNSGLFWSRNSLTLWPGLASAKFLPPIMPGLSEPEFLRRLRETIETESDELILEAASEGLSRPIPPEWYERLKTLRESKATGPAL